ncbi:HAD family hydrolase [Pseudothermotoga thermarum]|uniref:HAD-superfamily hydrolase, subfamily IA, variant 3 n=1 Tax=Pseudothermotoga thermarum DSM 5069 TaxID=688269 RepID=F7YUV5_9THEM|nr:HAD family phosphatase [Pseudothermotoga thermarum]AEH51515.1 HAD-superfamily hydrolase, subfamily IA, variant 3 [Pseudothermotoga thermarum DSM 5069]
MVKNVVFDLGGVLLSWEPYKYMLENFGKEVADFLNQKVFEDKDWWLMDQGVYTEKELWEKKKAQLPEYRHYLEILEKVVPELLVPIQENVSVALRLKELGYKIYILSNFSKNNFDYVYSKYDFFKAFDGMVISSHVNVVKPDEKIYRILIERYSLIPQECLYVDDRKENVEMGLKLGFFAVHLEVPYQLKSIVEKILKITL